MKTTAALLLLALVTIAAPGCGGAGDPSSAEDASGSTALDASTGGDASAGADTCGKFTAAYCANVKGCGIAQPPDPCVNQAGFKDNVTSKCQTGLAAAKSTQADFDACTAHLQAGQDCGSLAAAGNPCANATKSFK